jgi:predicted DNA-binding WGR domain protein
VHPLWSTGTHRFISFSVPSKGYTKPMLGYAAQRRSNHTGRMMHRRLEHKSTKEFWEIIVEGRTYTVVYGDLAGEAVETEFGVFMDAMEAKEIAQERLQERIEKGYVEIHDAPEEDPEYGAAFLAPWLDPDREPNRWLRKSQETLRATMHKLPRFRMYNDQMRMAWCLFALGRYEQAAVMVDRLAAVKLTGTEGAWLTLFSLDCIALQARLLAVRGQLDRAQEVRDQVQRDNPFSLPPEVDLMEISKRIDTYADEDLETGFLALSADLTRLNSMLECGSPQEDVVRTLHGRALSILKSKLEDTEDKESTADESDNS